MNTTLNATDIGKHWNQFNDGFIRDEPRFIKLNRAQ